MKFYAFGLAVFTAAFAAAGSAAADDKKDAATKLDGTYTIVRGERDGRPIPDAELQGAVVTFKGERVYGTDKDKKEFFAATFQLDTATKPYKISMTSTAPKKDEKAAGVIAASDDGVKICYALPGGATPTEFKAGEKQQFFLLKRQAK